MCKISNIIYYVRIYNILFNKKMHKDKDNWYSHNFLDVEYNPVYQIALLYYNFKKFAVEDKKAFLIYF